MKVIKWLLLPIILILWYVAPVLSITVFIWLVDFISDWWTIIIFIMFTFISGILLWLSIILPTILGSLVIYLYNKMWVKYLFAIVGAISLFLIFSTIKYNPEIRIFLSSIKDIYDDSFIKGGLLFLIIFEFGFILLYSFILAPLFMNIEGNDK